ncbi:DNA polymerase delta subunit 4-like [Durio zibethinus]|uniref:DNA polymerase delta subunit 4-like n=1 Tax=Durio zibethinus TaxID=66656 RepID=A0A6P5YUJ2_DURZI|nr:DNA polymerase delta subunit 4-like [Durio zibethinus]
MATTSKNMKGFYRQKKNKAAGGITKSKSSKSTKNPSLKHAATFGSDITQSPALISHGGSLDLKDDLDEQEQVLRLFDMNMAYGPCLGITRLARWERAQRLGLSPPKEIENLLKGGKVNLECLFDGRV